MEDILDLNAWSLNGIKLGSDAPLTSSDGVELTRDGHVLTSIVVSRDSYRGQVFLAASPIGWEAIATPQAVIRLLGEPYWRDDDDDEVILFYEYESGAVELQFEFPEATQIGFISLARPGVLADPEQRKAYGVTKPWPPDVH